MRLALPLSLEGPQILDANGVSIAIIRGEMAEYRERGAEIVAAVNTKAALLTAAKAFLANKSHFWRDALQAAIIRAEGV